MTKSLIWVGCEIVHRELFWVFNLIVFYSVKQRVQFLFEYEFMQTEDNRHF